FDGNGKRIHNFTYTSKDRDYVGLFGSVGRKNALIKNLGLIDVNIDVGEGQNVGSLVGNLREATVRGCYARGGSVSGDNDVGGLVGYIQESTIADSYAAVTVSGGNYVGGLVGHNWDFTVRFGEKSTNMISNCCSTGSVLGKISVGGLVGNNHEGKIFNCYSSGNVISDRDSAWMHGGLVGHNSEGIITNCYSNGYVSGFFEVGGLIGGNRDGTIIDCYSTGGVTGTREVGGLVGSNSEGTVSTSFWDRQRSGLNNMCGEEMRGTGCDDSMGRTTAEMQTGGTFLEAGWDFVNETANGSEDVWSICEGMDYPKLDWQFITGDFNGDYRVNFVDFAFFVERWLQSDSSFLWCGGADLSNDGKVDIRDLLEFAENWLAEGIPNPTAVVYLIIDDFESYNDLDSSDPDSNRIFDMWSDGYDNPLANGAVVGHTHAPYAERDIVYGGEQSMPYYYDAIYKVAKSELILSPPQNWLKTGAKTLSLWFHGDSMNGVTPMSVVLNGGTAVYHDNPEATRIRTWTEWIINLEEFTGVDLANVSSIAICLGNPSKLQAGGTGKMFFDSIRLYGPAQP
ncbi:MAG: GLUG motif-containing protein, partial [Sedimentisphaerales bacterium]|nr:GLUG motif-containing protein [Sedimentisphaerales bacterium]